MIEVFDQLTGFLQTDASGVDHQVIMVRVGPFVACVIFVMVDAVAVDTAYFGFGFVTGNVVLADAAVKGAWLVAIAEYLQYVRFVFQYKVGTAAYNDTGAFRGQFLYDFAFGYEQYVFGRKAGLQRLLAVFGEDALQPEGGNGLFVLGDVLLVHVAALGGEVDELFVVQADV